MTCSNRSRGLEVCRCGRKGRAYAHPACKLSATFRKRSSAASRAVSGLKESGWGFLWAWKCDSSCMLGRGPACMARPYSRDLRERVVGAVENGVSRRKAAAVFGVGIATVIEWMRVWRNSGRLEAKPMGGDRNSRLKEERVWLLERIAAAPDLTLEEIRAELAARGKPVGYGTVWRFFAAEDISFKKNRARQRTRAA